MNNSNRSKSCYLPKFPRLQFMQKKREDDLKFYADEEFMLHVVPRGGKLK